MSDIETTAPVRSRWTWDYALMIVTVGLLGALGTQSLLGTLYVWWAQRTTPDWEQTGYDGFVTVMNAVAAPLVIALVVVMGLCVPKRLLERRALLLTSAGMLAVALLAGVLRQSLADGLAVYLLLAALIQVAVVVLTASGSASLTYLTAGRITKLGSGLLHLGIILFTYVVVALQDSSWMLPVFGVALVLTVGGMKLSFYAEGLLRFFGRKRTAQG